MEEQNKNKDGINQAKEPLETYFQSPGFQKSSKRITFSTLEEQEEENYRYWLSLTPEQRLANVTFIIKKIYAKELAQPSKSNRIFFDVV